MIKKLDSYDVAKIRNANSTLDIDKGQYNQFLMSVMANPNFLLIGDVENGVVKSFALFVHSNMPPISNTVILLDIWTQSHKDTKALGDSGKEWMKSLGAKKGLVHVDDSHSNEYMESFGLKKVANVYEWSNE